jgi:hypothetical protein
MIPMDGWQVCVVPPRSIHLGETGPDITDIANPWVSGAALFFFYK